ncbi:hypothetical protein [Ornithinibacillus xuwenensis]|uniref:Uncharacterized protein n=1 Tax=Ornithinibacillus xuwenensis TaxID=3144668 RepID=A0ABU9XDB0_9BACI
MVKEISKGGGKILSTKTMLLGIAIMLVAIYIPHEVAFRTGGYEISLLALGFILVVFGLFIKEKKGHS